MLGFDLSINPFSLCPSYQPLAKLPFAERIAALRDPQVRARLLMEEPGDALIPLARLGRGYDFMWPLGDPPNYEPTPEDLDRRAGRARRASTRPSWPTTCCWRTTAAACCWWRSPTTAAARSTRSMR